MRACLVKGVRAMLCFCCYRHISRIQKAYLFWRNPIFLIYINDRHGNESCAKSDGFTFTPGSTSPKTNKYHLNQSLITWQRKNTNCSNCTQSFAWNHALVLYLLNHERAKLPMKESTINLYEIPFRITPQHDLLTPDRLMPCACLRGNAAEMYMIWFLLSQHHRVARARKARLKTYDAKLTEFSKHSRFNLIRSTN